MTYLGLYALQHRGQESRHRGDRRRQLPHREGDGLGRGVFSRERLRRLPGHRAIGHVLTPRRAARTCATRSDHRQDRARPIAIAHNATSPMPTSCAATWRRTARSPVQLRHGGHPPPPRARAGAPLEADSARARQVKGAYSLLIMTRDAIYAMRDPHGFRPLTIGRLEDSWCRRVGDVRPRPHGGQAERDVEPGEMVIISDAGLRSHRFAAATEKLQCVFEYVTSRAPTRRSGAHVHTVRKAFGRQLAREYPVSADIVIPVPTRGRARRSVTRRSGHPVRDGPHP